MCPKRAFGHGLTAVMFFGMAVCLASMPAKAWTWCFSLKDNVLYDSELYNYPSSYNGASAAILTIFE